MHRLEFIIKHKIIMPILSILAYIIGFVCPIRKGVVLCWSFNGKQYGGNVMYISNYLREHTNYRIVWVKAKGTISFFPTDIELVDDISFKKILLINTAEFLISDCRIDFYHNFCHKRPGQKYIMTWHGGIGNKKIEGDAISELSADYIKATKEDSENADLFISCSKFLSNIYRTAFWYKGEILEKGMPTYDVLFRKEEVELISHNIRNELGIKKDDFIITYAPTFRKDHTIQPYKINWGLIIEKLEALKNKKVYVLLKLHPALLVDGIDVTSLKNHQNVIDVTKIGDFTPLTCASDMMISDYSSTIFEFALLDRPAFIYAPDYLEYNRGYYFPYKELPFPFSSTQRELIFNITNFDSNKYLQDLHYFYDMKLKVIKNNNSCKDIEQWMINHSLSDN